MERRSRKEIFKPINLADIKVCSFGKKRLKSGTNFVSLLWGGGLITILFLVGRHCTPGPPPSATGLGGGGASRRPQPLPAATTVPTLLRGKERGGIVGNASDFWTSPEYRRFKRQELALQSGGFFRGVIGPAGFTKQQRKQHRRKNKAVLLMVL